MSELAPYRPCFVDELGSMKSGNIKCYAQYTGIGAANSNRALFKHKEFYFEVELVDETIVPGEWYRLMGQLIFEGIGNTNWFLRSTLPPKAVPDYDPEIFEKTVLLRRHFETNFHSEIISYANPC